jgi:tRNA threonylcarbamoyladenosine biosynthesis protein TsaE
MNKVIFTDVAQAKLLAKKLAKTLKGGEIFGLVGPLGSGKTTFTQALAKELKVRAAVTSPTFVIMNLYNAKLAGPLKTKKVYFYHLDLYRCKNFKEIKALGITDVWGNPNSVTVLEWANKIKKHLPKKTTVITFKKI